MLEIKHSAITVLHLKNYLHFKLKQGSHPLLKAPATEICNLHMNWYHFKIRVVDISSLLWDLMLTTNGYWNCYFSQDTMSLIIIENVIQN